MATFKAVVLKPNAEGRYNVKIRVTHKRKNCYIPTEYYRTKDQLTRDLDLKPGAVKKAINDKIDAFYETMVKHPGVDELDVKELADWLTSQKW